MRGLQPLDKILKTASNICEDREQHLRRPRATLIVFPYYCSENLSPFLRARLFESRESTMV